jgi:hypothetical protein
MTDVRDQLATLASLAGKEIERLGQVQSVDARDELRYRVWPVVADLIDVVQAAQDVEEPEALPATIPVEVVARAVGLMLSMANRLGQLLPKSEMDRFALAAAEVTEDLLSFCDPDELAAFMGREPASETYSEDARHDDTPIEATFVEEPAPPTADMPGEPPLDFEFTEEAPQS